MVTVDLYEHTKGEETSYYLIIDESSGIHIGDARKKYARSDATRTEKLTEIHNWRRSISTIFRVDYNLPTPSILQIFSKQKIEDIVIKGERANIHPIDEIQLVRTIVEELARIDPRITGAKTLQKLTHLGDHTVDSKIMQYLQSAYKHFSINPHAA